MPQIIFILDVNPTIGYARDNNKKSLQWLEATRNAYLSASKSLIGARINVEIIEEGLSTTDKAQHIVKYIKEAKKNGYR